MVSEFPFEEDCLTTDSDNFVVRRFKESLNQEELKWHWDEEDRVIHPIHRTDWLFQLDNQLPIQINDRITIPKGVWHRIIKGTGDLSIIVEKKSDI
jgi:hypothetical protein